MVGAELEAGSQTTITNGPGVSTDDSSSGAGAAYVFARSGTTWSEQAYLKAANAEPFDRFGGSVGISNDTVVVGAVLEDSNQTTVTNGAGPSIDNSAPQAGAAYVFVF